MNRKPRRHHPLGLLHRALRARKRSSAGPRSPASTTLEQLKDSRRPLLFSIMPRMLRDDGQLAEVLQQKFRYSDGEAVPPVSVSLDRWKRVLAKSRRLSRRRRKDARHRR